jgi:hypothetical protein
LYRRKESKLQWLEDSNEINGDNLNTVKRKASRQFKNTRRKYLKEKINEFVRYRKNKTIRDL